MAFDPDYGQTEVTWEELDALRPEVRDTLGEPVLKSDLYDLEQLVQNQVAEELLEEVLSGNLTVLDLLTDHFVRELHQRLYGPIWRWGGRQRSRETNIGVPPDQIAVVLRNDLDNLRFQWLSSHRMTARSLGIAAHAAIVRIHPFADGNGRATRLLADLLFAAAQDSAPLSRYDWDLDRDAYIRLLRGYDQTRDPDDLTDFVALVPVEV